MQEHTIKPAPLDAAIVALLTAGHLPTADLADAVNLRLFACTQRDQLVGVVGLELHGANALLRSLAVVDSRRSVGVGAQLVAHAEEQARQLGIGAIYLLTTAADLFFARHGYRHVARAQAPAAIAATAQFAGLCPSSSAFMVKSLDPQ